MERRKPKTKSEFFELEEQAWTELNGLVADLPAKALRQKGAAGEWSVKDVWAHLAAWMRNTRRAVPHMLKGEKAKADIQNFNDEQYKKYRRLTVKEARARVDLERKRFLAFAKRLPEDQLLRNSHVYTWMSFSCYNHYDEHIPGFKNYRETGNEGQVNAPPTSV